MIEQISVLSAGICARVSQLQPALRWICFALAACITSSHATAANDSSAPEIDGVYVVVDDRAVALSSVALEMPALLQLIASESNVDEGHELNPANRDRDDKSGVGIKIPLFVRVSSSQMPAVNCVAVGPAGYSSGAVVAAALVPTVDQAAWQAQCVVDSETVMVFINLIHENLVQRNYLLAFENTEQTLSTYLERTDLDVYFRTDMAALISRLYPNHQKARNIFANISPFVRKHIAQSKQRLLDNSWDQYLKQEQHSYSLAMRNGVHGRGYRLQNYLRDYPSGRFAAKVRVEIPERKKAAFLSKPRWAERRAENNLQMVFQWQDDQRKIDALKKYLVAYPHGRLVSLVRSEIGRVSNGLDTNAHEPAHEPTALSQQMTAENITK